VLFDVPDMMQMRWIRSFKGSSLNVAAQSFSRARQELCQSSGALYFDTTSLVA
jgi:hypothetical protein